MHSMYQKTTYLFLTILITSTLSFSQNFTESFKPLASDGAAGDKFGYSVDIEGDLAVVGAPDKTVNGKIQAGKAYVYKKTNGVWTEIQQLTSQIISNYERYGFSIAMDGNFLVIGEPYAFVGVAKSGTIHLYKWNSSTEQFDYETNITGSQAENFGYSVDIHDINGTDAVVIAGAPAGRNNVPIARAFYRVSGVGGPIWSQGVTLQGSGFTSQDLFGGSVAITEGTAVVGVPNSKVSYSNINTMPPTTTTVTNGGAVLQFSITKTAVNSTYSYSSNFVRTIDKNRNAVEDDHYGRSVDISKDGNTIVAGVPYFDIPIGASFLEDAGQVAISTVNGNSISTQYVDFSTGANLQNGHKNGYFGYDVSIDNDQLLIGGFGAFALQGRASLFAIDPLQSNPLLKWKLQQTFQASDGGNNQSYGFALGLSNNDIIISSFYYASSTGKAYIYEKPAIINNIFDFKESTNAIYPNPTSTVLHTPVGTITFYNLMGEVVLKEVSGGTIDVSGVSAGTYYVSDGKSTQLIIIQ